MICCSPIRWDQTATSDAPLRRLGGELGFRRQALLDRQRRIARPFVPGAEIHPHILHAGVLQRQERVRRARPLEAVEIDRSDWSSDVCSSDLGNYPDW